MKRDGLLKIGTYGEKDVAGNNLVRQISSIMLQRLARGYNEGLTRILEESANRSGS